MKDKKESKGIGWNLDNSYLNLPKVFFSKINLNPVSSPQLIILNDTLAKELGLDSNYLKEMRIYMRKKLTCIDISKLLE